MVFSLVQFHFYLTSICARVCEVCSSNVIDSTKIWRGSTSLYNTDHIRIRDQQCHYQLPPNSHRFSQNYKSSSKRRTDQKGTSSRRTDKKGQTILIGRGTLRELLECPVCCEIPKSHIYQFVCWTNQRCSSRRFWRLTLISNTLELLGNALETTGSQITIHFYCMTN